MFLRVEPPHLPCLQLEVDLPVTGGEAAREGGQGDHDAVRMPVGCGLVPRPVPVLKDPDPLVLEDHRVQIRVGHCGIVAHDRLTGFRLGTSWDTSPMGLQYHDGMSVPYELTGRHQQKARTRQALVEATRRLLAEGADPTVEEAAAGARISRTTAYRYFPNQRTLLAAAHPETDQASLLPRDPPTDP